ncbi:hypothetical protein ACK8HY_18695, partial [Sphingobacterium sp. NGMCC 1.201703]|uniref:hypothetical protein n=1 Tax=Sphingobacterium sp. NGMCC 1.201703 TaxID=3388657 RepID=UPI0039FDB676
RSVPFFTRKPLLETVKGFFRLILYSSPAFLRAANRAGWEVPYSPFIPATGLLDNRLGARATAAVKPTKP